MVNYIVSFMLLISLSSCGFAYRDKNLMALSNNSVGTPKEMMIKQLAEPLGGARCEIIATIANDDYGPLEACSYIITIDTNLLDDYVFFYKDKYVGYGDKRFFVNNFAKQFEKKKTEQVEPPKAQPIPELNTYTGTGWVTEGGYIVTNHHVIEGQKVVKVRFNSLGTEEYPATVALSDQHNDLAILKIESTSKNRSKGIPIASKLPKAGADVFTIGYPKSDIMGVTPKVTNGIISSLSGIQDDPRIIQTTVAIQGGNSGGPLLTMNGEVVGVTTSSLRTKVSEKGIDVPQGVNYAVKSAYVIALLSSLPQEPSYPMTMLTSNKLEDMLPKLQDSIVQIIVKSNK